MMSTSGRMLSPLPTARPASESSGTETPLEVGVVSCAMGSSSPWMYNRDLPFGTTVGAVATCATCELNLTREQPRSQGAASKSPAASAPPLAALGGLIRQISTHRPPPALRQADRAILHARWPQRTSTTGTRALWPAEPSIRPSSALCLRPSKAGRGALAKDISCEGTEPAAAR